MWIAAAEGSGIIEYSGCGGNRHEVSVPSPGRGTRIAFSTENREVDVSGILLQTYFVYLNCKLWSKVNLSVSKYLDSNMQRSSLHRC